MRCAAAAEKGKNRGGDVRPLLGILGRKTRGCRTSESRGEDAARAAAARREEAERQRAAAAKPVVVEDPTKPAPVKFVKSKNEVADETTRQRNKRKEGPGQAKFTLKEDRDCPGRRRVGR